MKLSRQGITTSVGYSFAFAALCSLAVSPGAAFADDVEASDETAKDEPIVSDQANNAPTASEKSETVYLFANPDGSVKNTEVSTTLKNPDAQSELADSSDLTDIENTEGDTTYSGSGKNMVWETAGENVYYTGNASKDAPVSIKVTYFLDGQKVSPDSLAGASGKLKIRYDYENNATVKATIKGKEETLYVPFTFVTAMLFDNANFKNAEVTNGKLIDDGDRAIVAGYAMPGLKKSLGNIVDDFDIPDYFEVTADVTDFEMKSSLTIATAGLLEDLDTSDIDTSKLEDASSELTDAMGQIIDGAGELQKGLDKLAAGAKSAKKATGQLAEGAETLADGNADLAKGLTSMKKQTKSLPDGIQQLADGAAALADGLPDAVKGVEQLEKGAGSLQGYLEKLKGGLTEASEGADKLATGLDMLQNGDGETTDGLVAAKAGADKLATGLAVAKEGLASLSDAKQGVDGANALITTYGERISGGALAAKGELEKIRSGTLTSAQSDAAANLEGYLTAISDATSFIDLESGLSATDILSKVSSGLGKVSPEKIQDAIDGATDISDGLGEAIAAIDQLHEGANSLGDGIDEATAGLGDADTKETIINGAAALKAGATQLKGDEKSGLTAASNGAQQLSGGLSEVSEKIPTMISGINKIVKGADKLADGAGTLAKGTSQVDDGMGQLAEGTKAAADGSGKLTDGLQQFSDEGIGQITDIIDEDLLPFTDRLDALSEAAKNYDNFAGITKGTKGSVKFIFETDPIENSKNE